MCFIQHWLFIAFYTLIDQRFVWVIVSTVFCILVVDNGNIIGSQESDGRGTGSRQPLSLSNTPHTGIHTGMWGNDNITRSVIIVTSLGSGVKTVVLKTNPVISPETL